MYSTWAGYNPRHEWKPSPDTSVSDGQSSISNHRGRACWRPLGLLEAKFDKPAQNLGQADTFVSLKLNISATRSQDLFARLLLAWARLRAVHPALTYSTRDHETSEIPGVPSRHFVYVPPSDQRGALARAAATLNVEPSDKIADQVERILVEQAWNGSRVLLDEEMCLARLVVVKDERTGAEILQHGFLLFMSHTISDGISVMNLLRDLFSILADPDLPTPETCSPFNPLSTIPAKVAVAPLDWHVNVSISDQWAIIPTAEEIRTRLTLTTEDLWPAIPFSPTVEINDSSRPQNSEIMPSRLSTTAERDFHEPSVARRRWYWAITKTIVINQNARAPIALSIPRLPLQTPPPQPNTRWLAFKLDTSQTLSVVSFCKSQRISPSMLLYSLLSITISRVLSREHGAVAASHPILVGFPFSMRPFLNPSLVPEGSDISRDLAIRLTFGHIILPHYTGADGSFKKTAVLGAKMAKKQFEKKFELEGRELFLAEGYHKTLDRLLWVRYKLQVLKLGTADVKDGYRTTYGINTSPMKEPKTVINGSMIGDLDRILPSSYQLSSTDPKTTFELSELLVGTRLHRGEGMFVEAYTWEKKLTFSVGFDDQVFKRSLIDEILTGMERDLLRLIDED